MGLEDFTTNNEYAIGEVSTRKKIENVKLEEDVWKHPLYHEPSWVEYFAGQLDDSSIKAMIEVMDELIEEGRRDITHNEEREEELKKWRNRVVDEHLKS